MPKGKKVKDKTKKQEPIEATLWQAADKLRKNMDAAEYKHIVLGLIFLKYISDAFEDLHTKLINAKEEYEGADPEDPNEYIAEKVFFVPPVARWKSISDNGKKTEILLANGKKVDIGGYVDEAMEAIERLNPSLKGVLPKVYARQNLDRASLGGLIDLIGTIALGSEEAKSKDVLGQVYEYFLGQFALAEGKKGGQFYTPRSVVRLLVEMLEPYEGRVFDPCCGSGGMFIQSEKFIKSHQDHYKKKGNGLSLNPLDRISIYGQESNQTTWRLAKMNLAIRGIDSSNIKWNNEGSFLNDAHKDLKADFIIANPPFNDSDWSGELLKDDARWKYGVPSSGNANFAWIQHFIYHLSPSGIAGFVMSNSALSSESIIETEIRKAIIESDLVDCIVTLPDKLFYSTPVPASLWFLVRNKLSSGFRKRENETLFIDASHLKEAIDRTTNTLSEEIIRLVANTYHDWKAENKLFKDKRGFCRSITIDNIRENGYELFPAKYIEIDAVSSSFDRTEIDELLNNNLSTNKKLLSQVNASSSEIYHQLKLPVSQSLFAPIKWIKIPLSDVLSISEERLGNNQEPEILTCTEKAGLILQRERFAKRIATEDTSKYKIVRKTDIVYNPYLLWAGAIDQCWIVDVGITSPAYEVLRIKREYDPTIIGRILKNQNLLKMYNGISVGAIQRRRRAPVEKFLSLTIKIPSVEDQQRFQSLTRYIQEEMFSLRKLNENLTEILVTICKNWMA
ncbi:MAG: N-6 DNA methylase [Thermodesulfovibrionales bacterium]|nr:N-6 DNA methylase [Thermodesulfovibrionales bacterium]